MGHDHTHHHHHHEITEIFKVAVLTLSDKGAAGEREYKSCTLIHEIVEKENYKVVDYRVIPDEQKLTEETLITLCDDLKVDLVLTTGGTGFSMRDRTPEATLAVADRLAPGISEADRWCSLCRCDRQDLKMHPKRHPCQ